MKVRGRSQSLDWSGERMSEGPGNAMHLKPVLLGTRPPETAEVGGRGFLCVDPHAHAAWRPLLRFGTCGVSGAGADKQNDRCHGWTCPVKITL